MPCSERCGSESDDSCWPHAYSVLAFTRKRTRNQPRAPVNYHRAAFLRKAEPNLTPTQDRSGRVKLVSLTIRFEVGAGDPAV